LGCSLRGRSRADENAQFAGIGAYFPVRGLLARGVRAADIAAALPDISAYTIRNALNALRDEGLLNGTRGRTATWKRADGNAADGRTPASLPRS
jgi:hypothetical protein